MPGGVHAGYDSGTVVRAIDPTEKRGPPRSPLEPGTIVAETYLVTALLGEGGMGTVWAAQHLRLPGKRVALKILHSGGRDGQAYARFRREAEIASRLGHPHIVEVLDFNTLPDGTPYLVLELLEGESLAARLARGRLPLGDTLDLLRQVGSALQAAHLAGVVHRDLKPDNIFLSPSDGGGVVHHVAKVLDFGISKIQGSQTLVTQEAVVMGTPRYMAPEQALGKNQEIDARADLFSLGVILYEMLAGEAPFVREQVAMAIYAVVHEPHRPIVELVPDLPPAIAAAIDRALAKAPDHRFPDVASFVEAVTGRPLQSLRESAPRREVVEGRSPAVATPEAVARTMALPSTTGSGTGPAVALPSSSLPSSSSSSSSSSGSPGGRAVTSTVEPVTVRSRPASPHATRLLVVAVLAIACVGGVIVAARRMTPGPDARADARAAGPAVGTTPSPGGATSAAPGTLDGRTASASLAGAEVAAGGRSGRLAEAPQVIDPAAPGAKGAGAAEGTTPAGRSSGRSKQPAEPHHHVARDEVLAQAAAAELADAEDALARGDEGTAERMAVHSLYTQKSSRAYAIVTRARCRKGDLGGARAAVGHVNAADRPGVVRDCAANGLTLR
jgi:serine/threonine protein kinase